MELLIEFLQTMVPGPAPPAIAVPELHLKTSLKKLCMHACGYRSHMCKNMAQILHGAHSGVWRLIEIESFPGVGWAEGLPKALSTPLVFA